MISPGNQLPPPPGSISCGSRSARPSSSLISPSKDDRFKRPLEPPPLVPPPASCWAIPPLPPPPTKLLPRVGVRRRGVELEEAARLGPGLGARPLVDVLVMAAAAVIAASRVHCWCASAKLARVANIRMESSSDVQPCVLDGEGWVNDYIHIRIYIYTYVYLHTCYILSLHTWVNDIRTVS
ncbi:hypothetical protein Vafri_6369, partial [Volvox africanus]